ncbi:WYL domain-containing protein [Treponema sp.]|uniref:WYL domain-containing protein n=1 Tax=Treponema sp. TaxID=166 RepID=UPI003FA1EC67
MAYCNHNEQYSLKGKKSERDNPVETGLTIYPLRLLFKSKAWYLKSLCAEKNDYRFYDEFPPDLITKNTDGSYTLSVCLPTNHWT